MSENTKILSVNGEYITACKHDDAVNILRNAGDIVVLTVKHYRAATPFLQKQGNTIQTSIATQVLSTVLSVTFGRIVYCLTYIRIVLFNFNIHRSYLIS